MYARQKYVKENLLNKYAQAKLVITCDYTAFMCGI